MRYQKQRMGLRLLSLTALACILAPCVGLSQELTVKPSQITVVDVGAPDNATISVMAYDAKFKAVKVQELEGRRYQIGGAGPTLVIVSAVDAASGWQKQTDVRVRTGQDPPPDDDEDDSGGDEDDPPPGEYSGPDELGLGSFSFQYAPSDNPAVSKIFRDSVEMMAARPALKVISADPSDSRKGTSYELPVYWAEQMAPIAKANADWANWYNRIFTDSGKLTELNKSGKIRTRSDWSQAMLEIAAGVEARK